MLSLRSLLLAFPVALSFCVSGYGQTLKGPDQDPFPGPNDPFWATNGVNYSFPLLDGNKKFQKFNTKIFYASTKLQANHDIDSQQVLHGHFHVRDDYKAVFNTQNIDFTGQANDYWDVVFQFKLQANINRYADANTQYNCFSHALNAYFVRGTYNYWIDDSNAAVGLGGAGEQTAAFLADAFTVAKANVTADDVLLYNKNSTNLHATGVNTTNCGPPRSPNQLGWKYGGSGYYTFTSNSFNTPMFVLNGQLVAGQPLPAGSWQLAGAGSELPNGALNPTGQFPSLNPTGKIWRAHPAKN